MALSRVFSSGVARLERHRQRAGQAFALRLAICTLHERPVHPGPRQSEGGALYLRCVGHQGWWDGGGSLVRCRQAEHRRQWLAHRLFLFLARAILSGQTLDEMPGRNAVGGVPQREVHCRPCRSVKSNLCLRN